MRCIVRQRLITLIDNIYLKIEEALQFSKDQKEWEK